VVRRAALAGVVITGLIVGLLPGLLPGGFAGMPTARAAGQDWAIVKQPGHVALMRHAEAPGTLDPKGFRLDDCTTQRNLDDRGRAQARAIGAAFAKAGVVFSRVLTSAWCRCKETAALVHGREAVVFVALNSFAQSYDQRAAPAARVRQEIDAVQGFEPVLMVTHQVMITELTGIVPASGEVVVVKARPGADGKLDVVARLSLK
jgi:phosphohistidine phosphatase SixA